MKVVTLSGYTGEARLGYSSSISPASFPSFTSSGSPISSQTSTVGASGSGLDIFSAIASGVASIATASAGIIAPIVVSKNNREIAKMNAKVAEANANMANSTSQFQAGQYAIEKAGLIENMKNALVQDSVTTGNKTLSPVGWLIAGGLGYVVYNKMKNKK